MDELLIYLLELLGKLILACVRYIDSWDRGLVLTLGGCGTQGRWDLASEGLVKFMAVFVAKRGSTYP